MWDKVLHRMAWVCGTSGERREHMQALWFVVVFCSINSLHSLEIPAPKVLLVKYQLGFVLKQYFIVVLFQSRLMQKSGRASETERVREEDRKKQTVSTSFMTIVVL